MLSDSASLFDQGDFQRITGGRAWTRACVFVFVFVFVCVCVCVTVKGVQIAG